MTQRSTRSRSADATTFPAPGEPYQQKKQTPVEYAQAEWVFTNENKARSNGNVAAVSTERTISKKEVRVCDGAKPDAPISRGPTLEQEWMAIIRNDPDGQPPRGGLLPA